MATTRPPPWRSASSAAMSRMLRPIESSCIVFFQALHVANLHVTREVGAEIMIPPGGQGDRGQPETRQAAPARRRAVLLHLWAFRLLAIVPAAVLVTAIGEGSGQVAGCWSCHFMTSIKVSKESRP